MRFSVQQNDFKIRRLGYFLIAMMLSIGTSGSCYAQVGRATPEHELLKKDEGVWDADCKFWLTPGQEPLVTKGRETNTMLGDLWLISDFETDLGGLAFSGHNQTGYDAEKKKFVGTWVDSMNPNMSMMWGTYDAETKTFNYLSYRYDPISKEKKTSKMVVKHLDDDHRIFETFDMADSEPDQWNKTMEIKYKRVKTTPANKPTTAAGGLFGQQIVDRIGIQIKALPR